MKPVSLQISVACLVCACGVSVGFAAIGESEDDVAKRYQAFKATPESIDASPFVVKGDKCIRYESDAMHVTVSFKDGKSIVEQYEFLIDGKVVPIGGKTMAQVRAVLEANSPNDQWAELSLPQFDYAWQSGNGPTAVVQPDAPTRLVVFGQ